MKSKTASSSWGTALRAAFPVTLPVLTGFACLGLAYGLLMQARGYGPFWSALMCLVCYCGSMQYVAIALLTAAFDPLQAFLLSVMVNARHMFYGLSLLEQYRGMGAARFPLIYTLTDETFSLVSSVKVPEGVDRKRFYLSVSLLNYVYWFAASLLGGLLGKALTMDLTGVDFALTALFVVLFMEQWNKKESRPAGLVGLGCAALALGLFGEDLVIPAMALILAVLLGGRKVLCR
ncbi:AzlC family ABC transporter permease [Dysosmobacter sp.]|uniref:AzlC family ABC transporter permease n=1 Tax=Dysosmobacter sp. TaxID=2591382 RepID=UPI002A8D9ACC|nr:AzlC family ABC transporter permease [Dysosmobacter sp.]MDY3280908.1 AzlC family ABC transporter permease [Dysosmobacter sp.]